MIKKMSLASLLLSFSCFSGYAHGADPLCDLVSCDASMGASATGSAAANAGGAASDDASKFNPGGGAASSGNDLLQSKFNPGS